jgi:1-deoxy-D-xylulose-5-phosphate synthase
VTGNDGPSHNGMWDLSVLGLVPGLRVAAPRDGLRLRELLGEAVRDDTGPTALRFPKGPVGPELPALERVGHADVLAGGPDADIALLPVGAMAGVALAAGAQLRELGVPVAVVDPRWIQPVDAQLLDLVGACRLAVTIEDNGVAGGFGDAFARAVRGAGLGVEVRTLGLAQAFLAHGEREDLLAAAGLDAGGIVAAVVSALTMA